MFNCPANLASHRRWHKPRIPGAGKIRKQPTAVILPDSDRVSNDATDPTEDTKFTCTVCGKGFRRQAYLKKHIASHQNFDSESVPGNDKDKDVLKYPRRLDDFGDDVKIMEDAIQERFMSRPHSDQEFSAFRLVHAELSRKPNNFEIGEELRDTNFNHFWNKIPPAKPVSINYFADCENAADKILRSRDSDDTRIMRSHERSGSSKQTSPVSSDSEESQTLDITGSEDEAPEEIRNAARSVCRTVPSRLEVCEDTN